MKSFLDIFIILLFYTFNVLGLPLGFNWPNILSPIFLTILLLRKNFTVLFAILFIILYMMFQLISLPRNFIFYKDYFLSAGYFITSIIAAIYFYEYLKRMYILKKIEYLFKKLLQVNAILIIIAIILYFTSFRDIFWGIYEEHIGAGEHIRLKMFFSEPAHYAFLIMPLLLYTSLKLFFEKKYEYKFLFIIILLGALFSQSAGTLGSLFFAILLTFMKYAYSIIKNYFFIIFFIIIIGAISFIEFGDSMLNRIDLILNGSDHSGKVRTIFSALSAYYAIDKYNYFFGLGFGQVKYHIIEFTRLFPGYSTERLPSSFSSTLATIGILGIGIKFLIVSILFYKQKVYQNIFQLTIFFYVLIYGFTGGWMININEMIVWVISFSRVFPEFNSFNIFKKKLI